MRTAINTVCGAAHHRGTKTWHVSHINGRRYTVCAHPVPSMGKSATVECGELIDISDLPAVVICCGKHVAEIAAWVTEGLRNWDFEQDN